MDPFPRIAQLEQLRDDLIGLAVEETEDRHAELALIGAAASAEQFAQAVAEEHEIDRRQMSYLDIAEVVFSRRTAAQ